MTDRSEWEGRVGRKWADEWRRTDRSFSNLTDRLLARVSPGSPTAVLDVGCGAGELSLAFARSHAAARVIGIDVSGPLVAVARERGARLSNLAFACADAASWFPEGGFAPELLISRHGVMFFPDPAGAFGHLAHIAAQRAHLVFSCFRDREANGWASDIAALLGDAAPPPSDPHAPGPFAFADREHVAAILTRAGWTDIAFEPVDFAYIAGSGENAVADAESFFLSVGPAARAASEMSDDARDAFRSRLRVHLAASEHRGLVALPAAAWIVSAQKA